MLHTKQSAICLILLKIDKIARATHNYHGLRNVSLVIFIKKISYATRSI